MRPLTDKERPVYEQMIRGENYFPSFLVDLRTEAQCLCHRYNQLAPNAFDQRRALLEELFGEVGENVVIEANFHCDYGRNIRMGRNCFMNYDCVILDCAPVTFGEHVLCGPGCHFYTACHPMDAARRMTDEEYARPITVGNNVWFGGHVTVLPGVTIGDNCIIGAGSVVTKDLPPNTVACGNPARVRLTPPHSDIM